MNVHEFARLIRSGQRTTSQISGLCGRLIRGKKPEDFLTLTDDADRKIVMLIGPDGLQKMPGKNGWDMLMEIGYEPDYAKHKIEEGCQFKLVVFPEGGPAKLATWDNVLDEVVRIYPDTFAAASGYTSVLKEESFAVIESHAGYSFLEVEKAGKNDPRFMTYERFQRSKMTLVDFRAFLYFSVHLRELFRGDGYTDAQGKRGPMEYIVPNRPLAELGELELIDIPVSIPSATVPTGGSKMKTKQLPVPSFYNPANSRKWSYQPDQAALFLAADAYRKQHDVKPKSTSGFKTHLLIIDAQRDFCFPEGSLYVGGRSGTGAMDDSDRLAQFIYREAGTITDITTTLDTHFAYQIFQPWFWVNSNGAPLSAHTLVVLSSDERKLNNIGLDGSLLNEDVRPNPAIAEWLCNGNYGWLLKQCMFYCKKLAEGGKYVLYLWPPHCILGSEGHALAGVIHEARMFFSFIRGSQSYCEVKGTNALTENYSVLSPEVTERFDGNSLDSRNTDFIRTLLEADRVIIAGQASSHCVKSSIGDLLLDILKQDPTLAKKVYILKDCTSAVVVPDGKGGFAVDFTADADKAMAEFAAAGMNLVDSTAPIESWPTAAVTA